MATMALKGYQEQALAALSGFLRQSTQVGATVAFEQATGRAYVSDTFGAVPCVCLRIPTGGGKTLLAAHALAAMARDWRATDAPLAVWLVPSEAIRTQTLGALQSPGHPYRTALEQDYGQRLQVCDLDALSTLAPTDWGRQAIVVVATIQSFRVERADTRNVYAFSEDWERHFRSLPAERLQSLMSIPDAVVTPAEAAAPDSPLKHFVSQPRYSLANWLALHEPLLIVDEAHNTQTENSFQALRRLNPAAILELTATPIPHSTNVLYHVSAQELQAEEMIKLPITLREHADGWQSAVFGAVQTRNWLEAETQHAQAAGDAYVRPILLLQAQNEGSEAPPGTLGQHLVSDLNIPEEQIAVATGTVRGLEGIDLSSPGCPIRYVITVQALREGWDCPFAYVLCSLQPLSSATAVEQLLGRVLRMPYAKRRARDALNRAYAHVCASNFAQAANALVDRLVTGMGFEALDVASMVAPQTPLFAAPEAAPPTPPTVSTVVQLKSAPPALSHLAGVSVTPAATGKGVCVTLTGHVDAVTEQALLQAERGDKKREALSEKISQHNAVVAAQLAPSMRGVAFAPVPTLAYRPDAQAELLPLEREAVLDSAPLDLTAQSAELPGFQIVESHDTFEIYVDEQRVKMRGADLNQIALDAVSTNIGVDDLVRWLDREVRQPDIPQPQLRAYLKRLLRHLIDERHQSVTALARMRFVLSRRIVERIEDLRQVALRSRFQQLVLDGGWQVEPDWQQTFTFQPGRYAAPAGTRYNGRWQFARHYYPIIADLKATGEEFDCAQQIDRHAGVRHWVRNLDSLPFGFWLPTSRYRFFPDFLVELADGRVGAIEYKGHHLRNDAAEIEKRQVGELWAERSGGRCVFAFVYLQEHGLDVRAQLDRVLAAPR